MQKSRDLRTCGRLGLGRRGGGVIGRGYRGQRVQRGGGVISRGQRVGSGGVTGQVGAEATDRQGRGTDPPEDEGELARLQLPSSSIQQGAVMPLLLPGHWALRETAHTHLHKLLDLNPKILQQKP